MLLTTQQVAEKLGISGKKVLQLLKDGELVSVNTKQEGKKKFLPKFDSKTILEYRKTNGVVKTSTTKSSPSPLGVFTRLDARLAKMKALMQKLHDAWF